MGKKHTARVKANGKYKKQFDRTIANKKRRQARHKLKHPNDSTLG